MTDIVWKPTEDYIEKANITRFMKKHNITSYDNLIKRSNEDLEDSTSTATEKPATFLPAPAPSPPRLRP